MSFQYEPLNLTESSIRVLRVLPRQEDGGIVCEISTVALSIAYATLSYHWGPPPDEHVITLVASTTGRSGTVRVRKNLFDFLSRASLTEEFRRQRWWIDALCIDQARVDERNHQVQQMGSIYAGANRVHIWLGLDPLIGRLFTYVHKYWKNRSNKSLPNDAFQRKVMIDHRCADGISRLRTHPYWSRLWIIREILLSEELLIVAGHLSIPWESLSIITEVAQVADDAAAGDLIVSTTASNLPYLLAHRPIYHEWISMSSRDDYDLVELLELSAASFCQDPRDKLYGILALIRWDLQLPVDYQISVSDLFHEACSFYACWTKPEDGLGPVRRLADALGIDLEVVAAATPSSVVFTFTIGLVELETRFGRGTARIDCTECGADLTVAGTTLSQPDTVAQVWCIRMGTRPWLHIFFQNCEVPQHLDACAIAFQIPTRRQHNGVPSTVICSWSDMLKCVDGDDFAHLELSRPPRKCTNEGNLSVSQRCLLLLASLG